MIQLIQLGKLWLFHNRMKRATQQGLLLLHASTTSVQPKQQCPTAARAHYKGGDGNHDPETWHGIIQDLNRSGVVTSWMATGCRLIPK